MTTPDLAETIFNRAYEIGYRHGFTEAKFEVLDAIEACEEKRPDETHEQFAARLHGYRAIRDAIRALKPASSPPSAPATSP